MFSMEENWILLVPLLYPFLANSRLRLLLASAFAQSSVPTSSKRVCKVHSNDLDWMEAILLWDSFILVNHELCFVEYLQWRTFLLTTQHSGTSAQLVDIFRFSSLLFYYGAQILAFYYILCFFLSLLGGLLLFSETCTWSDHRRIYSTQCCHLLGSKPLDVANHV